MRHFEFWTLVKKFNFLTISPSGIVKLFDFHFVSSFSPDLMANWANTFSAEKKKKRSKAEIFNWAGWCNNLAHMAQLAQIVWASIWSPEDWPYANMYEKKWINNRINIRS